MIAWINELMIINEGMNEMNPLMNSQTLDLMCIMLHCGSGHIFSEEKTIVSIEGRLYLQIPHWWRTRWRWWPASRPWRCRPGRWCTPCRTCAWPRRGTAPLCSHDEAPHSSTYSRHHSAKHGSGYVRLLSPDLSTNRNIIAIIRNKLVTGYTYIEAEEMLYCGWICEDLPSSSYECESVRPLLRAVGIGGPCCRRGGYQLLQRQVTSLYH